MTGVETGMRNIVLGIVLVAATAAAQQPPPPGNPLLWQSKVWSTPYRADLPLDDKLAGLARVWAEAKFGFANFDLVPDLDWDAVYLEFLPKVRSSSSTLEYYRLLAEMVARLEDGHAWIAFPREIAAQVFSRPPLTLRLVEGRVLVAGVDSEELVSAGLARGDEIVAVNDLPVKEYAQRFIVPMQWASTPQDLDTHTYEDNLLAGPVDEPVRITTRNGRGVERSHTLARAAHNDSRPPRWGPILEFSLLPGNIGLLTVRSFNDPAVVEQFRSMYDTVSQTAALIIDIRENGGGNSVHGWSILSYLTDRPFRTSRWRSPQYIPVAREWKRQPEWHVSPPGEVANADRFYAGPVVVLTSARTYSAAEDFAVAFHGMMRGPIIGEATGGSTGQPLRVRLPGGGALGVCSKRDTYPDGTEFVGVGVQPDMVVRPTVRGFRAGKDEVRDAAVEWMRKVLRARAD
jgi:C-terminal processing protease CtpA/Prc